MGACGATGNAIVDHVIAVAGSRSYDELGETCHSAAREILGAQTVGLYLTGAAPSLVRSHNAPHGFLTEYSRELAFRDPLIAAVRDRRCAVPGACLQSSRDPDVLMMQDLLRRWGFRANICGPIFVGSEIAGFLYTADRRDVAENPGRRAEKLGYICRSAAISLQRILATQAERQPEPAECDDLATPGLENMPPRLAEVARLVGQGSTNKEIARALNISHHTVKEYITTLCVRLSVRNRTGIAAALFSSASPSGAADRDFLSGAVLRPGFRNSCQECDYF